ncbi:hypothetical protein BSR29_00555 [Boudabousia liubingyangii]|uniref:Glycosyltransferase WbuB n=1 Tax=Boudabousia liubingyangii TaxID=1921764 RepID=A0A1Q5PPM0_9ACTO|nr:glycosyltransferase family 4 protein [Boudabousia liubingyangii]OKL49487.1 hypothetical protein BSR29_00555 [Boudabousia liubingyangii]
MHILFISQYWHPEQGVVQRRWQWLSEHLLKSGHRLTVITPPPHYPGGRLLSNEEKHQAGAIDETIPNLRIIRTRFKVHDKSIATRVYDQAVIAISSYKAAKKEIKLSKALRKPVDVVCCTVPALPSALIASKVARAGKLPLVVELRDAWPEILDYMDSWKDPHQHLPWWRRLRLWLLHFVLKFGGKALSRTLKQADLIITTTLSLRDLELSKGHPNVVAVRNRADTGIPNCNTRPLRKDGPLNILYAGTVGRAQGLENAIRALDYARKHGADVRMRIAGGGAHIKTVENNAQRLNLPVEFFHRIPFHEVFKHYEWADTVLVHLQNWKPMEFTIPSKLFEAMWAEKHVSGSVSGEAASIIEESGIGHIVEPMSFEQLGNLWVQLYQNRDLLDVDGRGHDWFQNHPSVDELAKRWETSVAAIVQKAKGLSA